MAVSSVNEHWNSRSSTATVDEKRAVRKFLVLTDSFDTDSETVRLATGVPRLGDAFDGNLFLRANEVNAEQENDAPKKWWVTVTYSSLDDGDEEYDNPLDKPTEYSISTINESVYADYDADGDPVQNTASIDYDPPLERLISTTVLVVKQNVATFDKGIVDYVNRVNNDNFFGYDQGQCLFRDYRYTSKFQGGVAYWERQIEIHIREKSASYNYPTVYPWQDVRQSKGYMQRNQAGNDWEVIKDANGDPVSEPVALNSSGRASRTGVPTLQRFDVYGTATFANLNLGI